MALPCCCSSSFSSYSSAAAARSASSQAAPRLQLVGGGSGAATAPCRRLLEASLLTLGRPSVRPMLATPRRVPAAASAAVRVAAAPPATAGHLQWQQQLLQLIAKAAAALSLAAAMAWSLAAPAWAARSGGRMGGSAFGGGGRFSGSGFGGSGSGGGMSAFGGGSPFGRSGAYRSSYSSGALGGGFGSGYMHGGAPAVGSVRVNSFFLSPFGGSPPPPPPAQPRCPNGVPKANGPAVVDCVLLHSHPPPPCFHAGYGMGYPMVGGFGGGGSLLSLMFWGAFALIMVQVGGGDHGALRSHSTPTRNGLNSTSLCSNK